MAETEIVKKLIDINGEQCVSESEAMSRHTTFRIGGTADYFVMPSSISELQSVLHLLKKSDMFIDFFYFLFISLTEGFELEDWKKAHYSFEKNCQADGSSHHQY